MTAQLAIPDTVSVALQRDRPRPRARAVDAYGFALMPEITGAVGAVVSRFSVSGTDVVPPALAALHVSAAVPSPGAAAAHPGATSTTGDSGSETLQATLAGVRYQPFAPSGAAGVSDRGDDRRGGIERHRQGAIGEYEADAAGRRRDCPRVAGQSSAFAGAVMIAYSSLMLIAGFAERISAAMPAADGAAALVP